MSTATVPATTADAFATDVLASSHPVLVDFHTSGCQPCRMQKPVVERLANDLATTHRVFAVDCGAEPELAARFGVTAVPTLILFRAGQPVASHTGFLPLPRLHEFSTRV